MTDIFKGVALRWKGETYEVPADQCMKLAYRVEMALRQDSNATFFELIANPPATALAMAFGVALRAAGVAVSDEEVFAGLRQVFSDEWDVLNDAMDMLNQLVGQVTMPPELQEDLATLGSAGVDAEKKRGGG